MSLKIYKPKELIYSAVCRCKCGAGLAYSKQDAQPFGGYWLCSYLLTTDIKYRQKEEAPNMFETSTLEDEKGVEHNGGYAFTLFEIKSEQQPSANGATTRPK